MYQSAYATTQQSAAHTLRTAEAAALDRAIHLMRQAQATGLRGVHAVEAIFFTNRIWSFLIEDLSLSENELPDEVRANLISIGIHVLKRLDDIRSGLSDDISDVIELNEIIRDALT